MGIIPNDQIRRYLHQRLSELRQMPFPELDQEVITAPAHHRPQVCAVDEHLPHHEMSIRVVGDHLLCCKPPVCALGDQVLLESKKEQVKEPPEPTQELVVKASQEAGLSNTVDVGQFFRTRGVCDAHGRSTAPCC